VGVTGASGAVYALRTLRALGRMGIRVDLVVSSYGQMLLRDETGLESSADVLRYLDEETGRSTGEWLVRHGPNNMAASIASGTHPSTGMIVVPCSAKTLAAVAHGSASNLIARAADVTLKERRPLVLVVREAPFNRVHLENMLRAHDAGAAILPASPGFYPRPKDFDELADFIAGRALSLLGLEQDLVSPWTGRRDGG
jgi:4-hydroxy-3-polyprenylbenzoate decarboxylase